jgi:putative serine protease PepD
MTGYDAANPASRNPQGDSSESTGRLGPHPPRMEPATGQAAFHNPTPHSPAGFAPPHTSSFPAAPASGSFPATGAFPPMAGQPGHQNQPGPQAAPARSAPRRGVLGSVALVLVLLLAGVVALQAFWIMDLRGDYDDLRKDAAAQRAASEQRAQALDQRASDLERRTLDTAAVASSVLPSVFRVSTPAGRGTAFGFAEEAPEGGTYLITNYHVIDTVWRAGQREVELEQQNRRFPGQIVKVDEKADLALLLSTEKFPRLVPGPEPAKPGQPVVVVGSPLGLEDSVTSGVVSALRNTAEGQVLQFDAPVNPGNSGGPVVNAQGQVVGVVNAKLDKAEGISLGIPVAVVCQTFELC